MSKQAQKKQPRWDIEGVVFIIYKDGEILLEERPYSDPGYGGYIVIPGGKKEGTETIEQTLLREVEEEAGVVPSQWTWLDTFEHIALNGTHYLTHAYLVSDFKGKIQNREQHKGKHQWASLEKAEELLKLGPSRLVLFKAKEIILAKQIKG